MSTLILPGGADAAKEEVGMVAGHGGQFAPALGFASIQ